MATQIKPIRILLWFVVIASLVALGATSFLMQEARQPKVATASVCIPVPPNVKKLGPALAPREIIGITGEPEWETLKGEMHHGDTVHEFETAVTGGHLMLRGNCYLGQTVAWVR